MKQHDSLTPMRRTRRAASFHAHPPPFDHGASVEVLERAEAPILPHGAADIGATILICDLRTDEREEYTLVPPDDADILQNRISTLSPIGRALFGRREGDIVDVEAPAGAFAVRVERIRGKRKEARQ